MGQEFDSNPPTPVVKKTVQNTVENNWNWAKEIKASFIIAMILIVLSTFSVAIYDIRTGYSLTGGKGNCCQVKK